MTFESNSSDIPRANRTFARWTALCLACGMFAACRPTSPPISGAPLADHEMARVGSHIISVENFLKERARSSATESSPQLLERLIERELLYAEACRVGYDQSPGVKAAWKNLVIQRFQESLETPQETEATTPEAIEAEYAGHPERYSAPPQVRSALIQLPTATREARIAEIHAAALQAPPGAADFGALAAHSLHPSSRHLGGDIGWLTRAQASLALPQDVVAALFALRRPGEVSPVVSNAEGVFLLKLIEARPARLKPFEAVRYQVAYNLQRNRRATAEQLLYARLRAHHSVQTNQQRLAELSPATPSVAAHPPRLPSR